MKVRLQSHTGLFQGLARQTERLNPVKPVGFNYWVPSAEASSHSWHDIAGRLAALECFDPVQRRKKWQKEKTITNFTIKKAHVGELSHIFPPRWKFCVILLWTGETLSLLHTQLSGRDSTNSTTKTCRHASKNDHFGSFWIHREDRCLTTFRLSGCGAPDPLYRLWTCLNLPVPGTIKPFPWLEGPATAGHWLQRCRCNSPDISALCCLNFFCRVGRHKSPNQISQAVSGVILRLCWNHWNQLLWFSTSATRDLAHRRHADNLNLRITKEVRSC